MNLTIHRGSHQIGGSCVELACDGMRIIIDAGLPLDAESIDAPGVRLAVPGLFADAPDEKPVDALIISHAHQDHYGLLDRIRQDVPVYVSEGTEKLVAITRQFTGRTPLTHEVRTFHWHQKIKVGPFCVIPHLVDHSAFDAFALEIEANGTRVFYSGDFRDHGRLGKTLDVIHDRVKPGVDALLLEGTMLGRQDEDVQSEDELAAEAEQLCRDCGKAVLVYQSGQNVTRAVSFYKAARRAGREFLLDFYTAHVLSELASLKGGEKLPIPGHSELEGVQVWYPYRLTNRMMRSGHESIPNRFARWKRTKEEIAARQNETMLFVRPGMEGDLERMGDLSGSVLLYSLWEGYREQERTKAFLDKVQSLGVTVRSLHTSGHATLPALQRMVDSLQPKAIVPIHTEYPGDYERFGVRVCPAEDGEPVDFS